MELGKFEMLQKKLCNTIKIVSINWHAWQNAENQVTEMMKDLMPEVVIT